MSLTAGTGPFGKRPAGRFNFEPNPPGATLFWEQVPQRVRAFVAKQPIVDSRRAHLLHETGHLPVYYFPTEDVRWDLLEQSERRTHCPWKGEASYWSIRVGQRHVPDAVWAYREPIEDATFIGGHVALDWSSIDEWFVEEAQAFGHPRDPYHRIDVYPTLQHVRVLVEGQQVAESRTALALFETGHPTRYYLPAEDIRWEMLEPSPTKTRCAYKGSASFWHVRIGEILHEDVFWTYRDPQHDAEQVRDRISFFQERSDLELDGGREERPVTQWSR
jgi:uncharacterized protein (DUF427 family)